MPSSNPLAFCHGPLLPSSLSSHSSLSTLSTLSPFARRPPSCKPTVPTCMSFSHPPNEQNISNKSPLNQTTSRRQFLTRVFAATFFTIARTHAEPSSDVESAPAPAEIPETSTPPPAPPTPLAVSTKAPKWSYEPPTDPSAWGDLSPEYSLANTGQSQSPIALSYRTSSASKSSRPKLTTTSSTFVFTLQQNPAAANPTLVLEQFVPPPPRVVGDAPPVDLPNPPSPPAFIMHDGATYAFRSAHFHAGASEHVIENTTGVLEMHMVFDKNPRLLSVISPPAEVADGDKASPAANTLVVAVLAKEAPQSSPWLAKLLRQFIEKAGEDGNGPGVRSEFNLEDVLERFDMSDVFVYSGSLTVPPCTEGVTWVVFRAAFEACRSDVDAIVRLQRGVNVRPLQEVNERTVTRYPRIPPPDSAPVSPSY